MTRSIYWVWRRELHDMLRAPLVYGIGGVFLFVQGVAFAGLVGSLSDPQRAAPLGALLEGQLGGTLLTWVMQLVVLTLLGMRAIADDKRSGAWELLLTAQVSEGAAVLGKWLAASTLYALLWIPTLVYLAVVALFRADSGGWELSTIASGYLGAIAVGFALLAWAITASAATRSTLAAGALGFFLLVGIFLIGELPALWPELPVEHPGVAAAFEAISIRGTVLALARGEITGGGLALIAGLAVTGLALAITFACLGRRHRRELRLRVAGTLAIAAISVLLGIHAAKHPVGIDVSAQRRNTLDPATREVLAALPGEVRMTIVLPTLGGLEPIYDEVAKVASRMADAGPVTVRTVDPASAPGGIAAIARTAGLARGDLAQGGAVVLDLGGRRRVVDLLALASLAKGPGDAPTVERLAIEQALTGALVVLANRRELVACATTGHGELPMSPPRAFPGAPRSDGADWSIVADRLRAEGFTLEDVTIETGVPARCRVLIVAGPAVPLGAREALAIQDHVRAGRGLLVAASSRTLPGSASTGLEGVLAAEGLGLPAAIAIDPSLAVREVEGGLLVQDGYADHPINAGFPRTRATLWFQPRAVVVDGGTALIRTSPAGWGERDFIAAPQKDLDDLGGPVALAALGRKLRVIAVGSAESFATSLLAGGAPANDLWLAHAVRWLGGVGDRSVEIAARAPTQIRLVLTATEKRAITLMCVVGIPLAWLVLGGGFVLWRLRRGRGAS